MKRLDLGLLIAAATLVGCGSADPDPDPAASDTEAITSNAPSSASSSTLSRPSSNDSPSEHASSSDPSSDPSSDSSSEAAALAEDDIAFLKRLGLIRGHLHAGHALYINDLPEMAATHMKHPRDELYAGLVPAIEARGLEPFDAELTALKDAVESDAATDEVTAAWREVDEAIERIERGVAATPAVELRAIAAMLDTAADEYEAGVVDGVVEDAHEYQDAWGFMQVGLDRVGQVVATSDVERSATAEAAVAISSLEDLWPGLDPKIRIDGDSERIRDAAERIRGVADGLNTD